VQPNPWCVKVWDAMAKTCGETCKQQFSIAFITGWPALGTCVNCKREWLVHKDKIVPKTTE
jgi:hypothetical protein